MTAALAALLLAQRPKSFADLPFVHEPGRIWLKAHLNDRPIEALLDTGASVCVSDVDAASAAGAKGGHGAPAVGVGSQGVASWFTRGLRLSLDGLDETQEVAYASDLRRMGTGGVHRPGALVGGDFLKRFAVEIDYAASRVRLYASATYVPPGGVKPLPARFEADRPIVGLDLRLPDADERTVSAEIDTGSASIILSGAFVARERLLRRYPDAKPYRGAGGGIGGKAEGRLLPGISGFLGPLPFGGEAFLDTGKGGETGPRAPFDVLVGDGPLAGGLLILDYGRSTLYVGRARATDKASLSSLAR